MLFFINLPAFFHQQIMQIGFVYSSHSSSSLKKNAYSFHFFRSKINFIVAEKRQFFAWRFFLKKILTNELKIHLFSFVKISTCRANWTQKAEIWSTSQEINITQNVINVSWNWERKRKQTQCFSCIYISFSFQLESTDNFMNFYYVKWHTKVVLCVNVSCTTTTEIKYFTKYTFL